MVSLTRVEKDILQLYADGKTELEIAKAMNTSSRTVGLHLANVSDKFGVRTSAEVIAAALEGGYIQLSQQTVV